MSVGFFSILKEFSLTTEYVTMSHIHIMYFIHKSNGFRMFCNPLIAT